MFIKYSTYQVATAIAILFHAIGFAGIVFFKSALIISATPVNLLLMFVLLVWTQAKKNLAFWIFVAATALLGFTVELIGVNTQALFGDYRYGTALGYRWNQVPLMIGINWFITIYCCGICIHMLLMKAIRRIAAETASPPMLLKAVSVIADGATLAVLFDWLMEPVAVKLGYWQWNGDIPLYNYICWLMVAAVMLTLFHFCNFNKQNKFAVHLLLIQAMFFLLLRTFLN